MMLGMKIRKIKDILNRTFDHWTVLGLGNQKHGGGDTVVLCRCRCGQVKNVLRYNLLGGGSTKCRRCGNLQRGDTSGLDVSGFNFETTIRRCPTCGEDKPLTMWKIIKPRNGRMYPHQCKECRRNEERFTNRCRDHGLTPSQFRKLLIAQDYKCGICDKELTPTGRDTHIDHCHASDRIRGVLCFKCNTLLGNAKDSIRILRAAISYLKKAGTLSLPSV